MNDDRVFDFADLTALGVAFTPDEIAWATVPAPWRRDHTSSAVEWEQNVRGFIDFLDDEPAPVSLPEEYVRSAVGNLARSIGEEASVQSARLACIERKYAAFLAERTGRPKVGPLFSPLEVCWLIRIRCLIINDRDPAWLRFIAADRRDLGGTLGARLWLESGVEPVDDAVRAEAEALIGRYLDAEALVLRQAATEAMAASEPAPQRARRRL
ncbi:hypothetical protein [Paraburkholderia dilworthii]|uniref:Uncharacterized protein n=1 Tax=Paraburkholderia dilworthii TaxID=948106 RepID=A0ABW9D530_9BURK